MTRAETLKKRMSAKALSTRELAKKCAKIEYPDGEPEGRSQERWTDWNKEIRAWRAGPAWPRDKKLRILSAALEVDPADWPPGPSRPTVAELDRQIGLVEERVEHSEESIARILKALDDAGIEIPAA